MNSFNVRLTWAHAADRRQSALLGLDETVMIEAPTAALAIRAAQEDAEYAGERRGIDLDLFAPVGEIVG